MKFNIFIPSPAIPSPQTQEVPSIVLGPN
jgi:hypothetical protein